MIEREFVFRLRLPKTPRARWMGLAAVSVLAVAAVAYAAVPNVFNAGEPLSAAKLNQNFSGLDDRLSAVERGGNYCGMTAPVQTRLHATNGYAEGAMRCSMVAGCGTTGHICTPPELVRFVATASTTVPKGWIATGNLWVDNYSTGQVTANDCTFFTSNTGNGTTWNGARAELYDCANVVTLPLLCCK
jgi:hypothetical protein